MKPILQMMQSETPATVPRRTLKYGKESEPRSTPSVTRSSRVRLLGPATLMLVRPPVTAVTCTSHSGR